ncbi:hypothetical protein QOZ80_2BG0153550 [Eleusine coracana subsp. coracana]|nr:hypothetical protein QOZ80_2BG0153550 [Eleusine coracana subsp. coracana]
MRGSTAALMATAAAAALLMLLVSLAVTDTWTISSSYEQEQEQETLRKMFVEWKAKYGVTYKGVGEEECRYALFKNTHRRVVRANAAGVTSGINGLSGLASEEIFLGFGVQIGKESYEEETRRMFVGWKAKYGKTYRDVGEEDCRYKLFKGNRRVVVKLNAAAGETAYGLNQFGDLTDEEVRSSCYYWHGGVFRSNSKMEGKLSARCQAVTADQPNTVDERLIKSQIL